MVALAMLVRWTLEGLEELSFVCVTSAVAVPCASSAEKWLCPAAGLSCQMWASGVEMKSWAFRGVPFPPIRPLSTTSGSPFPSPPGKESGWDRCPLAHPF